MPCVFLLSAQNKFPGIGVPGSKFVTFLWAVYQLLMALREDGTKCPFSGKSWVLVVFLLFGGYFRSPGSCHEFLFWTVCRNGHGADRQAAPLHALSISPAFFSLQLQSSHLLLLGGGWLPLAAFTTWLLPSDFSFCFHGNQDPLRPDNGKGARLHGRSSRRCLQAHRGQQESFASAVGLQPLGLSLNHTSCFSSTVDRGGQRKMEKPQMCPLHTTRLVLLYYLTSHLIMNRDRYLSRSEKAVTGMFSCLASPYPPVPWPVTIHRAADLNSSF